MPKLSEKIEAIHNSPIAEQMILAEALSLQGVDVIDLTVGELDFEMPENAKEAACRAVRENRTHYTKADGCAELKEAIARRYGVSASQVSVTNGGKTALHALMQCLLDRGEEVILPAPYWPCFYQMVRMAEAVPVIVSEEDGLLPMAATIRSAWTEKTKALILNSPCNPSGQAYTKDQLKEILDFCREKDIFCLYDGSYADLYFENKKAPSPLDFGEEYADYAVCVGTASKGWAMSGWRIGWCIAPEKVAGAMSRFLNNCIGSPSEVSQRAFLAALEREDTTDFIRRECQKRCELFSEEIETIPGLSCKRTQGGFYVFVKIEAGMEDTLYARNLLEQEHVAVVAGSSFGLPGYFRVSCCKDTEVLKKAAERIRNYQEKKQ